LEGRYAQENVAASTTYSAASVRSTRRDNKHLCTSCHKFPHTYENNDTAPDR